MGSTTIRQSSVLLSIQRHIVLGEEKWEEKCEEKRDNDPLDEELQPPVEELPVVEPPVEELPVFQ